MAEVGIGAHLAIDQRVAAAGADRTLGLVLGGLGLLMAALAEPVSAAAPADAPPPPSLERYLKLS